MTFHRLVCSIVANELLIDSRYIIYCFVSHTLGSNSVTRDLYPTEWLNELYFVFVSVFQVYNTHDPHVNLFCKLSRIIASRHVLIIDISWGN
jgi:hypothetical protein